MADIVDVGGVKVADAVDHSALPPLARVGKVVPHDVALEYDEDGFANQGVAFL